MSLLRNYDVAAVLGGEGEYTIDDLSPAEKAKIKQQIRILKRREEEELYHKSIDDDFDIHVNYHEGDKR